jgi:xylose isomerase
MPEKKPKSVKFRMETAAFSTIWRNHISHPKADSWKTFVLNCFERFTESDYNKEQLNSHDINWLGWKADAQYEFLSERCYTKCIGLKGKLKREKDYDVDLPEGYLNRAGAKKRTRVSIDDVHAIFTGKDI